MTAATDKSFKMKMRDVENAFKYRRIPYPKRSVELIALLAISCTFFLFMHTNKLNSRLKEMEVKLQPSEFSALGLTGNQISGRGEGKHDINTLQGTYQYLKSTGQLHTLTPEHLNNTGAAGVEIVFFNRVPKVGSQTMMSLMRLLGKRNKFGTHRDKPMPTEQILLTPMFQTNLVDEILEKTPPAAYSKHTAYVDFAHNDAPHPIYLNLVRDPIERLISWFYYIRAPWYIAERKKLFPKTYNLPKIPWLKKSFDTCILEHDPECLYLQGEEEGLGDHRRQMLFFCGQDTKVCMPFNSYHAMQLAKRNVETRYAVVGSWEDTNVTLTVLEHYIPRFFTGAKEVFYKPENNLHKPRRRPRVARSSHHSKGLFSYRTSQEELNRNRPNFHATINNLRHKESSNNIFNDIDKVTDVKNNIKDHVNNKIEQDEDEINNDRDTKPAQPDENGEHDDDDEYFIENELNADALNNTKKAQVDLVVFNRVPKVGSQSLMELMHRLGAINGFEHSRDAGKAHETILMNATMQKKLITDLLNKPRPRIYSQHVAYINFTRFHAPKPIYINLVRDPIERIISWHYYVRAEWYYKDMVLKLKELAPKQPPPEFMNMDLDTCVRIKDKHCQFNQGQIVNPAGDHRRQTLFFCGQNRKLCMPFNSVAAMQKAKRTVEEDYAVVGTWEDTNITLTVLEHYVPKFFRNAKVAYYLGKDRLSKVNRNNVKKPVSDETREILRRNLTNEIEFYEFCKQRLFLQYAAINEEQQIDNDDYLLIPEHEESVEDEDEQEL